jgi:TolB-like protein/Tfp pilus assembly protein PilF
VDLTPNQDYAYFSDGLADEVLHLLSQAPNLTVIARTSSFSFRDRRVDIATIARKLKVGYVLEGSVRRDGGDVRITAQLIEAANSSPLWSATFDRELDNILAVQREIAAAVANALQARLAGHAGTGATDPRNAQAYDDFLRGRFFFSRRGPGDLERARLYYQRSVANDPSYARAWAGVAGVYRVMTAEGLMSPETGLPRLLEAAQKAIALVPDLAEGHVRLANYHYLAGHEKLASEHLARAARLDPPNPLILATQAGIAAGEGRLDQAIALQRRLVADDPLSAVVANNLGHMLFAAGRLDEARVQLLKALELSPGSPAAGTVAQILVLQREFDAALEFIERSTQGRDREQGLALVHHALGRTAEADAALARLAALSATDDPFRLAEVHAYRGEADESFKWLARAARPLDSEQVLLCGARQGWEMRASPLLESLHGDPRWAAWVAGST